MAAICLPLAPPLFSTLNKDWNAKESETRWKRMKLPEREKVDKRVRV